MQSTIGSLHIMIDFPTAYSEILKRIDKLDPISYGRTRNFVDGDVSYLSPYISRGVISTRQVLDKLLEKGCELSKMEKFVQELAWRDYWQQVWIVKGEGINADLKRPQEDVDHHQMPVALEDAQTGIEAVDDGIKSLKDVGYMHNHMRMYVASIACNVGKSHWKTPAQWLYYYLLDGDWASNALSWQWVAGSNAGKKYLANQENINKYFHSEQKVTFLDAPYSEIASMNCPKVLLSTQDFESTTKLPSGDQIDIDPEKPTLIYNYYNIDPLWRKDEDVNRILLLEPSIFDRYPVAPHCIDFILSLRKNIDDIRVYVGEFESLKDDYSIDQIIYKEHPLNRHYRGIEDPRDWMSDVKGYFSSFFQFWNKVSKELRKHGHA